MFDDSTETPTSLAEEYRALMPQPGESLFPKDPAERRRVRERDQRREAIQRGIKNRWAQKHGLRETTERRAVSKIFPLATEKAETGLETVYGTYGKKYCLPPNEDHNNWWLTEDGQVVFTMQPYTFNLERLQAFCDRHSLEFSMSAEDSWHYPGSTVLVVIRRKRRER